jgi:hypothetical protein
METYISFPTKGQPACIAQGDLNRDGMTDIIIGNYNGPNISVLYSTQSPPFFQDAVTFGENILAVSCITIADINQDGWLDILFGRFNPIQDTVSNRVFIYQSTSDGTFFSKLIEYSFKEPPSKITLIDVNKDSLDDIIIAHGHTISVYIAKTTLGQFNSPLNIILPLSDQYASIQDMEANDLNGDGRKDLILTDIYKIYTLKGTTTSPYFSYYTVYELPDRPETMRDIATGDLNNDGFIDVAALCNSDSIGIFTGNADGILSFACKYTLGNYGGGLGRMILEDFNDDHRLDVAISNESSFKSMVVVVLHDSTSLGFEEENSYVFGGVSLDLTTFDINNDNRKDIIAVDHATSTIAVILAAGPPGEFSSIKYFRLPGISRAITTGDVNCDGYPDILSSGYIDNSMDNIISIIPSTNKPDEFGAIHNLLLWKSDSDPVAMNLETTDMNNDSLLDIAICYDLSGYICVIPASSASGIFKSYGLYPAFGQGIGDFRIVDIDQDEIPDIVVNDNYYSSIEYLKGSSNGNFSSAIPLYDGALKYKFTLNDFNRDGKIDVATIEYDSLAVFLNKGNGQFTKVSSIGIDKFVSDMTSADLNCDGNPDIIIAFGSIQTIFVYMANDSLGHFNAPLLLTIPNDQGGTSVDVADMDGDGLLDIITETYSDICIFTAYPNGGFSSPKLYPHGARGWNICVEDFNADMKPDICVSNDLPLIIKYIKNLTDGSPAEITTTAYLNSPELKIPLYFSTGSSRRFGKILLNQFDGSTICIKTHARVQPSYIPTPSKPIKRYYEITSNASNLSGKISLTYELSEVSSIGLNSKQLQLYRYHNGQWQIIQGTHNPANQTITAIVDTIAGIWTMCNPNDQPVTSVVETYIPDHYSLCQNYPNPFNPITNISFSIPTRSFVSIRVFDLLGREVSTIVSEQIPAGNYTRQWNAANFPSGVYFYHLKAGSFTETKKLLLLK